MHNKRQIHFTESKFISILNQFNSSVETIVFITSECIVFHALLTSILVVIVTNIHLLQMIGFFMHCLENRTF